eukprot:TRINITY_DN18290_c0_g1_i1.p1 TRINITY_DN18290_c0_g1~~TRINITY_DN18290_c0_g1_i1.p1  ORF type:complete len:272 (-),score=55.88 TRINITY_DN18290_c0_g1_i1:78-893(-)
MLCKVHSNYRAFFKWLTQSCNHLTEGADTLQPTLNDRSDLLLVADFLHHDLNSNRVGQILESPADGMAVLFTNLQQHLRVLTSVPGAAVCSSFKLRTVLQLLQAPEAELSCRIRSTVVDGTGSPYVYAALSSVPAAAAGQARSGRAWMVRHKTDGTGAPLEVCALELEGDIRLVACDFYDLEQISILGSSGAEVMHVCLASYNELEFQPIVASTDLGTYPGNELELSCKHQISTGSKPFTCIYTGSKPFACVFRPTSRLSLIHISEPTRPY